MRYTDKGKWTIAPHGITSKIMSGNYMVAEGIYKKKNAYLIAAAPMMYEALKVAKRWLERQLASDHVDMEMVIQALAQAQGKEIKT